MKHQTKRIRHDTKVMTLTVTSKTFVTPRMLRVDFCGDALQDFTSPSPDDYVKLYFPGISGDDESRDFTPRYFDPVRRSLSIDFALHDGGLAMSWANKAAIGDKLRVSTPPGSFLVPDDFDWWLLIGDETALPSIGRRVEELSPGVKVITIVAVTDEREEQVLSTKADHRAIWVHRSVGQLSDPAAIMDALNDIALPEGVGFVWIAAEARVARAAKRHVLHELAHPSAQLKASGYWVKGKADAYDRLETASSD